MRKPLPILGPNKRDTGTYEPEDYPRPINADICPLCNSSHCPGHKPPGNTE